MLRRKIFKLCLPVMLPKDSRSFLGMRSRLAKSRSRFCIATNARCVWIVLKAQESCLLKQVTPLWAIISPGEEFKHPLAHPSPQFFALLLPRKVFSHHNDKIILITKCLR